MAVAATVKQRLIALQADHGAAMVGWGEASALLEETTEWIRLEKEAEVQRILATIPELLSEVVLPDGLAPGDPWPEELEVGRHAFAYAPAHRDLMDTNGRWVSESADVNDWRLFADTCAAVLGDVDCDLLADHCGHVAARNRPEWGNTTYVGTMDQVWLRRGPG